MKLRVSFDVIVPEGTDYDAIQEWLEFELGALWTLRASSISNTDLEAEADSVTFSVTKEAGAVKQ